MKKGINTFKLFILVFLLIVGSTACTEISKNTGSSRNSKSGTQISEASNSEELTKVTAMSDNQIIEAFLSADDADWAMGLAEELPDRYLGSITSEEDAKEKADAAWTKISGFEDAPKFKPYIAKFYDEYGVWFVSGSLPSGIDSNGRKYVTPGEPPGIIIRSSDGKVLAAW